EEIQKVKDENLREENIGNKFKYCFVIEKIADNTAILIIANFDHDFVSYQPIFKTRESINFKDEIKSSILYSLAHDKLIIDLTNPEKNEVKKLTNSNGTDADHLDFIDQYINIEKTKNARFSMNGFSQIPTEIFRKLLFINDLFISDFFCYLEANDFSYLENLVHLHFMRGVHEIRPNAFNGLNNLVYLNLNYCSLSYLEEGCFDGLKNLKFLNLRSNLLREIRDCVFAPLKKLIHLDLSQNDIKKVVNLNGLESLRYLNINSPKLFKFAFNSSNELLSLEALKLNRILKTQRIDTESLKYLCLSTFPTELSSNPNAFRSLEYLEIDNLCKDDQFLHQFNFENLKVLIGKFDKMPKFGKNFRNLKYLKITDAENFDKYCFEYLNSLEYLDICLKDKALLIDNIEEGHFKGVDNLKYFHINLSFKESTTFSIKEPIFEKLIKVNENLEVSKNSQYFLSYVTDYKFDPLEYVNISDELGPSLDYWFWQNLDK
ncbi:unnamed protein product, partial [Brachionus calyciflorus]